MTNVDDDSPGITVSTDTGVGGEATLNTAESGTTDTLRLVLNTQPSADVTIPVSSSDTSEGTLAVTEVVFTAANWNEPQEVVVTGADDSLVDGTVSLTLVLDPIQSTDTDYADIDLDDVSWDNVDDDTATLVLDIDPTTTTLQTTEGGGSDAFTVALSAEPTATVSLPISSSDTTEGDVATTLDFTPGNWNTPQTVTVTGVDDALQDGNVNYTVVLGALVSDDETGMVTSADGWVLSTSRRVSVVPLSAVFRVASPPTPVSVDTVIPGLSSSTLVTFTDDAEMSLNAASVETMGPRSRM